MRTRYALLAATDAVLAARGHRRARRFTKPLLMPALAARRGAPTRRALLLGGAGDVALLGDGPRAFATGLGAFLLGHAAWVAALAAGAAEVPGPAGPAPAPARGLALPYGVLLVGANALLWGRTGERPVAGAGLLDGADGHRPRGAGHRRRPDRRRAGRCSSCRTGCWRPSASRASALPAHEGLVMATYASAQALLASRG